MRRAVVVPLLLFAALGCDRCAGPTAHERARIQEHLGVEPPAELVPVGARFEGVTLVGVEPIPAATAPGAPFDVVFHFEVSSPLPKGARAFTHLLDEQGQLLVNADGAGVVRELHPPDRWAPGERVRDAITIRPPPEHRGPTTLRFGFHRDGARLPVEDGDRTHVDLRGPRVGTLPPRDALPRLEVHRAEGIVLDGRLDEPAWKDAPSTQAFRHTLSGAVTRVSAEAKVLWDDEHLYFAVVVGDDDLRTPFTQRDDPLWEADVVELFLDPSGRGVDYLELQVSPRGVIFDTHYERRRVPRPIGHADFDSRMEAAVDLRGTLDDSREDQGYTVEAKVPFAALATRNARATRPSPGDEWRANFYVIDVGKRRGTAVAWSPPLVPDFHFPPRFGRLVFLD